MRFRTILIVAGAIVLIAMGVKAAKDNGKTPDPSRPSVSLARLR